MRSFRVRGLPVLLAPLLCGVSGLVFGFQILNVRYSDSKAQPVKQELNEKLLQELDYLQGEARRVETAVATDWAFQDVLLFVEPHGVGSSTRSLHAQLRGIGS